MLGFNLPIPDIQPMRRKSNSTVTMQVFLGQFAVSKWPTFGMVLQRNQRTTTILEGDLYSWRIVKKFPVLTCSVGRLHQLSKAKWKYLLTEQVIFLAPLLFILFPFRVFGTLKVGICRNRGPKRGVVSSCFHLPNGDFSSFFRWVAGWVWAFPSSERRLFGRRLAIRGIA